ncbi:AraC family transcriptional regulator [Nocardia nova]|uniref:AraC family transcriptional regulator n=1 Tax=Nocardia nova TaxID=37330 RepID=UPI000CEA062F|nr:AraC family transcriptional regulator [Nocardia nova]
MDILSETVAAVRTGMPASGLFVRHAPWGRRYPLVPGAGFHIVLQGSCWLLAPEAEPVAMGPGDVLFMPRGAAHVIADSPDTPITEVATPGEPRELPGPGARTSLLCGAYELCRSRSHPLLDQLPDFLYLPADPGRYPTLRAAVDLLVGELTEPRPGSDAAIPALLDTLLLFVLRSWYEEAETSGWAGAFADPAVSAALRAIHDEPARAWTVPALSAVAGVSRATLTRRFTATVGEAPLSYLTRWRMLTAARLLRDTELPIAAIAHRVGYGSEFAFAKAFKREYALAPGRYRRTDEPPSALAV